MAGNEARVWDFLWERIGNPYGVAGLMGNLQAESGMNPQNLQNSFEGPIGMNDRQYTEAVDSLAYQKDEFVGDGAGYGIAQWTYWSRKRGLYEYAEETGRSIGDLGMQLEFLWKEIGQEYKHVLLVLLNAKSVREASDAVMLEYEKPADQSDANRERRAALGGRIFNEFWGDTARGAHAEDESLPPREKAASGPVLTVYRRFFYDSDCYKQGTRMTPAGVQVHSTGANNPWLRRYVQPDDGRIGKNVNNNSHNGPGNVCANAYIGKQSDGTVAVYEALPWDMRCWLSGSGNSGNANRLGYVGFEVCEDGLKDRAYFDAAMDQAVLLTAWLCQAYGIGIDAVRDHAELHEMGLASNHSDITHWLSKFGLNMGWFRDRVKGAMKEHITVEYIDCDEITVLYQARVIGGGRLNIRSGPGTKYSSLGQAADGSILDVLEETNADWARVRQGDLSGYAMRAYLEKVGPEPVDPEPAPEPEASVKITLMVPADALRQACDSGELIIDCRSGNVANIDYQ